MARFVFITGGVVSSLGKGLASAALGALLQARGFSVRLRKLDPYLNVDPGTMSPFEHGEVFVTDDGAETDLDLGHYERFTGVPARATDSISSGASTRTCWRRSAGRLPRQDDPGDPARHQRDQGLHPHRRGRGRFHALRDRRHGGRHRGPAVLRGDPPVRQDKPRGQCIFMHLTLLPYIAASGELKTKPTQHSVKELRSIGIAPDILVCRSERPIPQKEREKLALFCNVRPDSVIAAYDLKSIYEAPLAYHREGLDQAVLDAFGISPRAPAQPRRWEDVLRPHLQRRGRGAVAIVGKYTQLEDAYKSIAEALTHGGMANRVKVGPSGSTPRSSSARIPRPICRASTPSSCPAASASAGTEGKIKAAQFARERKIPYLGICLGMQMAVIEAARNLVRINDAGSEEFDHEAGRRASLRSSII
jgi:CTP synthase